jgi:hypothetical protein
MFGDGPTGARPVRMLPVSSAPAFRKTPGVPRPRASSMQASGKAATTYVGGNAPIAR